MSLAKSPTLTPQKTAANQANACQSQGPATAAGMERMRDNKVQHGFYSELSAESLRALGEDPAGFDRLLASLKATWNRSDEFELFNALHGDEEEGRAPEFPPVRRADKTCS